MDSLVWGGRALLAAVFATAGISKLMDRAGSQKSLVDFGVPPSLTRPLAWALPIAELVGAALVMPAATARGAALLLLALLLLFIAGIGVNLARGRTPECHCFGQLHSAPVGWQTLVRNTVLAAMAVLVISYQPQPSLGTALRGALAGLTGSEGQAGADSAWHALALVSTLLSLITALLSYQLVRQNGRLLLRLEAAEEKLGIKPATQGQQAERGLAVGTTAPALDRHLHDLEERRVTLRDLREVDGPLLLVFTEPGCGPCEELLPDIATWQRAHAARVQIIVMSRGTVGQNRNTAAKLGLRDVLLQTSRELAEAYRVVGSPSAVLVVGDTIAAPIAEGPDAVRQLVSEAARLPLKRGTRAPEIRFPNTEGQQVDLTMLRGRRVLLLFWNPGCGYCQAMLDDLKRWERDARSRAPTLIVVSAGSADSNRAQGLRAPVLLDEHFSAGPLFGVDGTPSAVVIDEHGVIASGVGIGADQIFALAAAEG